MPGAMTQHLIIPTFSLCGKIYFSRVLNDNLLSEHLKRLFLMKMIEIIEIIDLFGYVINLVFLEY